MRNPTNPDVPPPALPRVPSHLARRFYQICMGILAEVTPPGLAPLEIGILACIDNTPGIDQRRVADRLAIDPVTTGQRIDHLHALGYVAREVDSSDRRVRRLRLTPEGRKFRCRIRPVMQAAHARTLEALSEEEQETLYNLLERVILAHEAYARPGNGRRRPGEKQSSTREKGRQSS